MVALLLTTSTWYRAGNAKVNGKVKEKMKCTNLEVECMLRTRENGCLYMEPNPCEYFGKEIDYGKLIDILRLHTAFSEKTIDEVTQFIDTVLDNFINAKAESIAILLNMCAPDPNSGVLAESIASILNGDRHWTSFSGLQITVDGKSLFHRRGGIDWTWKLQAIYEYLDSRNFYTFRDNDGVTYRLIKD